MPGAGGTAAPGGGRADPGLRRRASGESGAPADRRGRVRSDGPGVARRRVTGYRTVTGGPVGLAPGPDRWPSRSLAPTGTRGPEPPPGSDRTAVTEAEGHALKLETSETSGAAQLARGPAFEDQKIISTEIFAGR